MKYKQLLIGLILSPFIGIFLSTLVQQIFLSIVYDLSFVGRDLIISSLVTTVVGSVILGLPWILGFGLPVYFILKKIGREYSWLYAIIGFSGGVLALILLTLSKDLQVGAMLPPGWIWFGIHGALVSLIFWYIVVFRPGHIIAQAEV